MNRLERGENVKLEWQTTTDFGHRFYYYLGKVKVGSISHIDHKPGEVEWAASTTLPIPAWDHGPYLGLHFTLNEAMQAVENAVDHFLDEAGVDK